MFVCSCEPTDEVAFEEGALFFIGCEPTDEVFEVAVLFFTEPTDEVAFEVAVFFFTCEPTDEVAFEVAVFFTCCEPTDEVAFEVAVFLFTCSCEPSALFEVDELDLPEVSKDDFTEAAVELSETENVKLEFAKLASNLLFFALDFDILFFQ